ncbi:hypothetical protein PRNP1_008529 [Phytophthora ramorum]
MDSVDRSDLLSRVPQRTSMGKKSMLRSPSVCVPDRLRSNQEESSEYDDRDRDSNCNVSTTNRRAMQHSASYDNARHEAATSATADLSRSKSVVVLRRCEDLNVRTGGFQKIEEAAHRLDIRRQRQQHQQQLHAPGDQHRVRCSPSRSQDA